MEWSFGHNSVVQVAVRISSSVQIELFQHSYILNINYQINVFIYLFEALGS